MRPRSIEIILHVVVCVVIVLIFADIVLGIFKVDTKLAVRWFDRLRAELATAFLIVLHEIGQFVSAQRASYCRICLSTVKHDQSWSCLTIVQLDIIVLKDFLTASEVHNAEIKSVSVDTSQTRQISNHVVSRLHNIWPSHWRESEHNKPWFGAPVRIYDPICISLVVEQFYADFSPSLINPVVHTKPILIDINAQPDLVCHLAMPLNVAL